MELVTRKKRAAETLGKWKRQYHWATDDSKFIKITRKLESLGDNPSPESVDLAIGNGSWTAVNCSECGMAVEEAVEIGYDEEYDCPDTTICKECLQKALKIFWDEE